MTNTVNTAITRVSIDFDLDYVKHWAKWYFEHGITDFKVLCHSHTLAGHRRGRDLVRREFEKFGSVEIMDHVGPPDNRYQLGCVKKWHDELGDNWRVWADIDEHVTLPEGMTYFSDLVNSADTQGRNVFMADMVDRIAEDGTFPKIKRHIPMSHQFPLSSNITRDLVKGWDFRAVIWRSAELETSHTVKPRKECGPRLKMNHYKWTANTIGKLRVRHEEYKRRGYAWYLESERALKFLSGETKCHPK